MLNSVPRSALLVATAIALLALPLGLEAQAQLWDMNTALQIDAGRTYIQFPRMPVYYCPNLSTLGSSLSDGGYTDAGISLEMVRANLNGALNEWFHAGANLRPFLVGQDAVGCANGTASLGTILVQAAFDDAGSGSPFQTLMTTNTAGEITSATVDVFSGEKVAGQVSEYRYLNGWDGGTGYDLWSVMLTGVGEAIGFCGLDGGVCSPWSPATGGAADPQSVVNLGTWTSPQCGTVGSWTCPRRHLLVDDFRNMATRYTPWSYGIPNAGFTTNPNDAGTSTNNDQLKYAFHDVLSPYFSWLVVDPQPEPYGATEISFDQPATCFTANYSGFQPPAQSKAYRLFVALSGHTPDAGVGAFLGSDIVSYTTDGTSNASLRNIISGTTGARSLRRRSRVQQLPGTSRRMQCFGVSSGLGGSRNTSHQRRLFSGREVVGI